MTVVRQQDVYHEDVLPFSAIRLPPAAPLVVFEGDEPLRFLHIIKTGGESLEKYAAALDPELFRLVRCSPFSVAWGVFTLQVCSCIRIP